MTTIETLRRALLKMHAYACGDDSAVYMSIPADPTRDADLLLSTALDELEALRTRERALIDELTEARREIGERINDRTALLSELERKSKDLRAWEIDARTAQARLKELEAGTVCTQAQTDIITKAMRESQAALATARAAMAEEAARLPADCQCGGVFADSIRALAPLPPSVRCVSVETLERVKAAGKQLFACIEGGWAIDGSPIGRAKWADAKANLRAALAELSEEKP